MQLPSACVTITSSGDCDTASSPIPTTRRVARPVDAGDPRSVVVVITISSPGSRG
jgi:hypothetical protein